MNLTTDGHRHLVAILTLAEHDDGDTEASEYIASLSSFEAKTALIAAVLNLRLAMDRADVDIDVFIESARDVILRHEATNE